MSSENTPETQDSNESVKENSVDNSTESKTAEETIYPTDQDSDKKEEGDESKEGSENADGKSDSGDSKENEDSKDSEDSKETKAPEKYDLKLPKDSLLSDVTVDEIAAFAKEQGLSNEQAQKLLDRENKAVQNYAEAQVEGLKEKSKKWAEDVKNDKELGGDNFKENVELAHRALEKFGSKQLKDTLEETGLGNHPELVRVFSRIGKAIGDDTFVRPGSEGSKQKSAEEIMYGGNG